MRCFIAMNLDDSLKEEINKTIQGLRGRDWDVRWVPAENLHVTLKFLGDTSEEQVLEIKERLSAIAVKTDSFNLGLYGVGIFPDRKRPRVVWIDLIDSEGFIKLQELVEDSMASLGFKMDNRPFSPHLTIGRIRSPRGKDALLRRIDSLKDKDFGNIGVDRISLMKSDLKPTGAQYTTLADFQLKRR